MTEPPLDAPGRGRDDATGPRMPRLLIALVAVIALEALGLIGLTLFLLLELLTVVPESYVGAIGLLLVTGIGAAWVTVIAVQTRLGRSWVRGAIVTVQVLALAVGIGSFQGLFARPDIGWIIVAPAVLALVLLFTRPVVQATARSD